MLGTTMSEPSLVTQLTLCDTLSQMDVASTKKWPMSSNKAILVDGGELRKVRWCSVMAPRVEKVLLLT